MSSYLFPEEEVLSWCEDDFSTAWRERDVARPLYYRLVDALIVIAVHKNGTASLLLTDEGFDEVFGAGYGSDVDDFLMCVRRLDRASLRHSCNEALADDGVLHTEVSWVNIHGSKTEFDGEDKLMRSELTIRQVGAHGEDRILLFAVHDITAVQRRGRQLTRAQLFSLRALFSEIFLLDLTTGESEAVWLGGKPLVDEDGREISVSFHTIFNTVHPDDSRMFWKNSNYQYVRESLFGENPREALTFELRRREGDDDYHWTRMFITRVQAEGPNETVLVCSQNIDAQMEAQRRERELLSRAQVDSLTGVYNHGTSEELIRARIESLAPDEEALFSIVDIDNFKGVNDVYGHQVGDDLLVCVANSLKKICRENDVVGRFGGDEFVMLFTGEAMPGEESIRGRFDRCKREISEGSAALGIDPPITASIGVVSISSGDNAYGRIFKAADHLLYEVKRSGKDGYRYADFDSL